MKKGAQKPQSSLPVAILFVLLAVVLAFLAFNLFVIFQKAEQDKKALQHAAEVRTASYRLVSLSRDAVDGRESAFAELQSVSDQMQISWQGLNNTGGLELSGSELQELGTILLRTKNNATTLLQDKERIIFLNQVAATLNSNLPQLQQEHTRVVEILLAKNAPADQVAVAQAQSWRAEKVGRNIDKMLAGGDDAKASSEQFNRDAKLFGRVLAGMQNGDAALGVSRVGNKQARSSLERIAEQFEFVNSSINKIVEATPALFAARQASEAILDDATLLQEKISQLTDVIAALPEQRDLSNKTVLIAGAAAIALIIIIGFLIYAGIRRSLRVTARANESNQQAILRLLDEIGDLADGDLTSHATVTEDFTGAIADSINYTIDQLRVLVARIQEASEGVSAAAYETSLTAESLTKASRHQAEEILGASAATNEMATTIDQVSANAAESAVVANRSVAIAKSGSGVVQNTIAGMDTIREQIQDTSKRIKRLGESSQEIGDIVSLINDIADQTNILALNAAIQASMAGEAGRGFAVVADEVQRLAERSAGATKQIASLVKTIQTDTNEAVSSMEQTTAEVVKGAELAQDAGVALEEIEAVSADLATLIQDISTAAKHQSTTAGQISNTMNVIQDITSQTLSGTQNTAASIGDLADLAIDLKSSVSGFRLPGESSVISADLDSGLGEGEIEALIEQEITEDSSSAATFEEEDLPEARVEDSKEETFSDEAFTEDLLADAEQVRSDLNGVVDEEPAAESDLDEDIDLSMGDEDGFAPEQDEPKTEAPSAMTPMEVLAAELAEDSGDWSGITAKQGGESENDVDNFTIDVDELDLAEIEAELGLTDEDLAADEKKADHPA